MPGSNAWDHWAWLVDGLDREFIDPTVWFRMLVGEVCSAIGKGGFMTGDAEER